MRIVAFSDWRVQSIYVLFEIIREIDNVDVIIYAGDDLNRFDSRLFVEKIQQKLQKNKDIKKSYIALIEEKILFYVFSQNSTIISEDKLKKLAIFEINSQKCEIRSEIYQAITGSRFKPGGGQTDAIKYKLKVGIESGRVIDINGNKIIVFTTENQSNIIPVIDFPNIFQVLSEKAKTPILGVIGNDDTEECGMALTGCNIFNIHEKPIKIGNQYFIGIHGAICDESSFKLWLYYKERRDLREDIEYYLKSVLKATDEISFSPLKVVLDINLRDNLENNNFISKNVIKKNINKICDFIFPSVFDVKNDTIEILTDFFFKYYNITFKIKNYDGGQGSCIGYVTMSESDAKKHLERQIENSDKNPIVISHTPPYGVLDIGRRFGIKHIGSVELRNFILKYKIPLVICGHVHGYGGYVSNIGKTTIVNVSSHDKPGSEGNIAVIDYEETVKVNWIKTSDYDRSLRKIKDIGIYREMLLTNNGIISIDGLLSCTDNFLMGLKTRLLTSTELERIFSITENEEEELILTLLFKYNLSIEDFERLKFRELNFKNKAIQFRKSHGKGKKRIIFLDNKTYNQLIKYLSDRDNINHNPIFFSSKEDIEIFEKLCMKISNVFFRPIKPKGGIGKILGKELVERAKAYNKDEPIIYNKENFPENIIYVDIETSPIGIDSSFQNLGKFYIYLIGVYDEKNGYQYFITKEKKPKEKNILKGFLNYLKNQENKKFILCAYNGFNFDFKHLEDKIKRKKLDIRTYKKIEKIDLLEICRKNLYVPKGYSLSVVAPYFGYSLKYPEKNGYHMGLEYQGFILGTLDEPDWEKIIEYNREDILMMKYIVENISSS